MAERAYIDYKLQELVEKNKLYCQSVILLHKIINNKEYIDKRPWRR